MATEQAAEDPDTTPLTAAERRAPSKDDVAHQLDAIRSTLQTSVLADVIALLAETAAPEQSELQRRARAAQVELTLRHQEVALEEWRRKLVAAGQEADRQRQLFARLEADFERRSAEFERRSADFVRRSAEFAQRAAEFERQSVEFGRSAALARETETGLTAAVQALEQRAAQLTRELAAASELNQARQQMIQTLEQDLARARQEKSELDELLARRESVLTEAQRRVEELRNSRWRQIGIGFGLAKRATFEK